MQASSDLETRSSEIPETGAQLLSKEHTFFAIYMRLLVVPFVYVGCMMK